MLAQRAVTARLPSQPPLSRFSLLACLVRGVPISGGIYERDADDRNFQLLRRCHPGAGYAGLMAALRLSRRKWRLRIALVSSRDQFLERVRLQESIVAAVTPRIPSISAFVAGANIEFIRGSVTSLDADLRRIRIATARCCEASPKRRSAATGQGWFRCSTKPPCCMAMVGVTRWPSRSLSWAASRSRSSSSR